MYAFDLKGKTDCIEDILIQNKYEYECETVIHKIDPVDIQRMLIPADDGESFEFV